MKKVGIGIQDFIKLRRENLFYVDKTSFIKEWWESNPVIMEFKVFHSSKEKTLEDTVQNALQQMKEKKYDEEMVVRGFARESIRHYGFAFRGKEVLIGS